jgi:methylenetetrahydrofolate reductase (NADPH)
VHVYPLGGLKKSAEWAYAVADGRFSMNRDNSTFVVEEA